MTSLSRKTLVWAAMFSAALLAAPRADAASFFFGAILDGSQEVPPRNVPGSGIGEVDVSDDLQSISVVLFVSGLTGNVSSGTGIYGPANPGQIGPLIFPLNVPFPSFTSGVLTGTFDLPGGPEGSVFASLMANQLYFDVFTDTFSATSTATSSPQVLCCGGEIRGQIVMESGPILVPEPTVLTLLSLGLAAIVFGRWRRSKRS